VSDLIDTTEMYLRTIFELEEDGVVPLRARIAERLQQSGPTVSQTVARMERDGLVVVAGDRQLQLTVEGRNKATRVMRKHRLAERLLVDVIGLEWEHAHEEACRWEHVMSERVERRLLTLLDEPTESPYGNPIPGLEELGQVKAVDGLTPQTGLVALSEAVNRGAPVQVVVHRLGEPLQTDPELMARLASAGVRPGCELRAEQVAGGVRVGGPEPVMSLDLPRRVASHVFVAA
jgi:DtxR family transcriptional regulator, Mn-dependent transcriptional regulator